MLGTAIWHVYWMALWEPSCKQSYWPQTSKSAEAFQEHDLVQADYEDDV